MATATAGPEVVWKPLPGSQTLFLTSPIFETIYEGTRGPGKTDALLMDFAQHVGQGFGANWRGILFRQTYPQLADVIAKSKKWYYRIFPGARYNAAEHTWTWPTGEQLLLRHMRTADDYWNYHGHEYPWVGFEELTNWPDLSCYDAMKSCCRSSHPGMPRKYRGTMNPWGVGHNVCKARFVDPAPPGVPFATDAGPLCVRIHGHWSENTVLLEADPEYPERIRASASSEEQAKAWLNGDWDIVAGGMFDDVWSRERHVLRPFPVPASWRIDRAFDWGSSKPFSVGWWAESDGTPAPDGRVFPRGSLVRIGEWYGWDGKNPNQGIRMADVDIARGIVEYEKRLGIRERVRPGPADASIFAGNPGVRTTAEIMRAEGVPFTESDKRPGSRVNGWEAMRRMLKAAGQDRPEEPGLWVFDTCTQFIRTVPVLPRDERKPDDVDTDAEDHIGDETRYRVTAPKVVAQRRTLRI